MNETLPLTTKVQGKVGVEESSKLRRRRSSIAVQNQVLSRFSKISKMIRQNQKCCCIASMLMALLLVLFGSAISTAQEYTEVRVDVITPNDNGEIVTKDYKYKSMVTLYVEDVVNNSKTPSGWSTRVEDGASADKPFEFQPGVGLIQGWTEGVLQMKEGERAWLHVPSAKGYGARPMGSPGGAFYIPANSDLLFDIEILGKVESEL